VVQEATTVVAEAPKNLSRAALDLLLPVLQQQPRLAMLRKMMRTGHRQRGLLGTSR
jgi:hypothetical protein